MDDVVADGDIKQPECGALRNAFKVVSHFLGFETGMAGQTATNVLSREAVEARMDREEAKAGLQTPTAPKM